MYKGKWLMNQNESRFNTRTKGRIVGKSIAEMMYSVSVPPAIHPPRYSPIKGEYFQ